MCLAPSIKAPPKPVPLPQVPKLAEALKNAQLAPVIGDERVDAETRRQSAASVPRMTLTIPAPSALGRLRTSLNA